MLPTQKAFEEAQKLHRGAFANLTAVECPDKDCHFCEPLAVALHEYAAEYRDLWTQRSDDADAATNVQRPMGSRNPTNRIMCPKHPVTGVPTRMEQTAGQHINFNFSCGCFGQAISVNTD